MGQVSSKDGGTSPLIPELYLAPQTWDEIQTNGYRFLLRGPANLSLDIEYSTNLAIWTPLQTIQLDGSDVEIVDRDAGDQTRRFYRASGQFVTNPFVALQGDYPGLFYPSDLLGGITGWADVTNSGFIKLTLATNGTFSGEVVQEETNRFSGALGLDLQAQVIVGRSGQPALTINLQLIPERGIFDGTVEQSLQRTAHLVARRAAIGNTNVLAGSYTLVLAGCDTGSCFTGDPTPLGDAPAAVRVSPTGVIQMDGTLADGQFISQSTTVSDDGYWPLYASPYQGRGLLIGWLNFTKNGGVSVVVWQKLPSQAEDPYFPNGFITSRVALVRPYAPPLPGQNAVNWTNGLVIINSGNLPVGVRLTNEVMIVNNQLLVLGGSISNLTLAITPNNGLFQGSFLDPVTGQPTTFNGTVVQSSPDQYPMVSGGWFLGTNSGGTIRLHPQ